MTGHQKLLTADISLLFIAFIRGTTFLVIKNLLDNFGPLYIVGLRFLFAGILMSVLFYHNTITVTVKELKEGLSIGLYLLLAFVTQTLGLKYTLASKQAFLTSFYVIIIPFLLLVRYKVPLKFLTVISTFLSLIGIAFICSNNNLSISVNKGDFLTLISAFFFSCHIISISQISPNSNIVNITTLQMLFSGVVALFLSLLLESPPTISYDKTAILSFIYLTIICTLLNFFIQNIAQKFTPASHVGILLCLESVFGGILSIILLKENFSIYMVIGSILLTISVLCSEYSSLQK
ncbi:DMT family transporter [Veillonella magna]|uniref:DMT family transporter n=1 Tax=Veillonella magna TaxID=464322 RepID=A0ABS2GEK3_9FIRM|nr:DMT family transporter [Veillonella magna]MBM6824310.1 DMT family transporter [Veillonella magna]MBM6912584.1 DMT family transporter [Veillonella magna]